MTPSLVEYEISHPEQLLTPALLVYADAVDANISATLRLMHGDPARWRPHLKTAKMPWVIRRLLAFGVAHFKCATSRELLVALESGAQDVLLAFPVVNAHVRRVLEIARAHPSARISVLIENEAQAESWRDSKIGVFLDVNPGMDRTGMDANATRDIVALARAIGSQFRGIHYYDGHISQPDRAEREREAHAGYDRLLRLTEALAAAGTPAGEIVTSGTPAFPYSMNYSGFRDAPFAHRASPGTVLFHDLTSLGQFEDSAGYRPAALILSTVISHPSRTRVTCDAGHKSVSADAGFPTCLVLGHPEYLPLKPSEEHLPIEIESGALPPIGSPLYLLPRHICPSVNNFDEALLIRDGEVISVEPVAARGHEAALARARAAR